MPPHHRPKPSPVSIPEPSLAMPSAPQVADSSIVERAQETIRATRESIELVEDIIRHAGREDD